jgi:hypothetical protein
MTYFVIAFFMITIGVVLGMRIERVHIRAKELLHRGRAPCLQCEQFRGLLIDANEDLYRLQSANRAQASTLAQAQDQIKMTAVDTGEKVTLVRDERGALVELLKRNADDEQMVYPTYARTHAEILDCARDGGILPRYAAGLKTHQTDDEALTAELQTLSLKFPALRTHQTVRVEPKPKAEWQGLFAVIMTAWLGLKSAVHFFLFGRLVSEVIKNGVPDYKRIAELEKDPYIRTDAEQIIALVDQGKWPADRTAA